MQPLALLTNIIMTMRADTKADVKFVGQLVIPEKYRILETGLAWYSKTKGDDLINEEGKLAASVKLTKVAAINTSGQFSVTVKGMPKGNFVNGAIYAKVIDAEGNIKFVYSKTDLADYK